MPASVPASASACFNYLNLEAPKVRSSRQEALVTAGGPETPSRYILELLAAPRAPLVSRLAQRKAALEVKSALQRIHKVR
jgi:hypothetical protein